MKTYYSIVSIATNPKLNEKFNIGLLCVTPENTFFHFSEAKFNIVSKLLSKNGKKLALSALKGMEEQIDYISPEKNVFSDDETELLNAVSETYISYLNRYNNNLVQYSSPITIDLDVDYEVYKALFKKHIYNNEIFDLIIQPKTKSFTSIRNKFRNSVSTYANTNFNVTNKIIQDLIAPVKVDAFGKNGAYVVGQTLDFEMSSSQLQSKITSFLYLTEHTLRIDKKSKSFVLGNEPSKKDKENHQLWQSVSNAKVLEFVPFDESERVVAYMKTKGVAPVE